MTVPNITRLLTPSEASEILGISLFQLYHLSSEAKIRKVKIGARLRFRPQDIEDFINQNVVEPLLPIEV